MYTFISSSRTWELGLILFKLYIVKPEIFQSTFFFSDSSQHWTLFQELTGIVEPVLKDHLNDHKNILSRQLVTGSLTLKCRTFCQKLVVLQDRWSLMAVVFQDRFHSTNARCQYIILVYLESYKLVAYPKDLLKKNLINLHEFIYSHHEVSNHNSTIR